MKNNNIKILIIGGGAIGALYGSKLALAGAQVSIVCRSNYNKVKKNGYKIQTKTGDYFFSPKPVLKKSAHYTDKPDYVVVTTKVLPQISVPDLIRPVLHKNTAIVLLQNGIGIESPIAAAFPDHELISALAFVCVSQSQPGHIHHSDYGRLILGNYPQGISKKTNMLCQLFKASGIEAETSNDIIQARWKKLVWNAAYNPLSVLAGGVSTHQLMSKPEYVDLIRDIMKEVVNLAAADGHPLKESVIQSNLDATLKMTPYKTSMLLDYEHHRPMEVEAILGNAIRKAKKFKIKIPHIKTLYVLLTLLNK